MNLKKVTNNSTKQYAKKDELPKNKLKDFTPHKWIVAASTGLVTLFYTSPKTSIHQIGVVFGCIQVEYYYNYTPLFHTLNSIMDIFYYGTWIFGISFLGSLFTDAYGITEEKIHKKMALVIKVLLILFIICLAVTVALVIILKQDFPAFFEGGIKKEIGNSLDGIH